MVKPYINCNTGKLRLIPSVPTFEYGISWCTCLYFHEHIPLGWMLKNPPPSQMQFNSANCAPTGSVIFRFFYRISFHVNCVLDIGVTRPSKLPFNIQNKVHSRMKIRVYASVHRRIILSTDFTSCVI